jgi:hypothetical protein
VLTSLDSVLRSTMGDTRMEHSTGSGEDEGNVVVVVVVDVDDLGRRKSLESLPLLDETMQLVKLIEVPESLAKGSKSVKKDVPRTLSVFALPESRINAALA